VIGKSGDPIGGPTSVYLCEFDRSSGPPWYYKRDELGKKRMKEKSLQSDLGITTLVVQAPHSRRKLLACLVVAWALLSLGGCQVPQTAFIGFASRHSLSKMS
jgi:hypothetical protein